MDDQLKLLSDVSLADILYEDDKHFKLGDASIYIQKLVTGAKDILEHEEFWKELPRQTTNTIHTETETVLRVINAIRDNKDNPQWLSSNLDGHIESISNIYNTLYPWLVTAIREYKNSVDTQKVEATSLIKELKGATKTAKETSKIATEASSTISTTELSKFFIEVATGDPSKLAAVKKEHKKLWRYKTNSYASDARSWFLGIMLSILVTGAVAVISFWGVDHSKLTLEEVLAKGLLLAAPAYAIKFCAKNYSLNKQLQITNTHRAVVMKTLLSFLQRQEITPEVREGIIIEAARQVFKPTDFVNSSDNDPVIEIPIPLKK